LLAVDKTAIELRTVRHFASVSKELIDSSIAAGADPPDVMAETPAGRRVAVEVTGYFSDATTARGSPHMAAQAEQNEVAERARACYERRNMTPLRVEPDWTSTTPLGVHRISVAEALCAAVERALDGRTRPTGFEEFEVPASLLRSLDLPDELESVTIGWGTSVTEPMWASGFGGIIYGDPSRFQQLIDAKRGHPQGYIHGFDEVWLLVSISIHGFGEISSAVAEARYELRGFDAVFFFDRTREMVLEARSV
jgi:hypothetical protein